jgi:uncharacterized protein YkwD
MPRPAIFATALGLAFGLALTPAAAAGESSTPPTPAPAAEVASGQFTRAEFATALLTETNRVRRLHGRRPLRARPELEAAADDQAAFMVLAITAQHTSPIRGQRTPADRVRRQGLEVEGSGLAENVASFPVGREVSPPPVAAIAAMLVEQWMNSPGHRANLLNPNFTQFGGAVRITRVLGDQWCAFGVQLFFKPPSSLRGGINSHD